MLNKLTLTNFQKHENLTLDFTGGLNVIRGANEQGKSTLYRAVTYALYGSRALPLSIDETVTWTKPVSSLKVKLEFTHTGNDYVITRSKNGAQIAGPGGLLVSGQSECTGFIEKLFNATSAVAASTMVTHQGSLQDSLDGGAVSLIEKLSNMALIDNFVVKIQDQLPCGNTKLFDSQLADLGELVEPVADFTTVEQVGKEARVNLTFANADVATATSTALDAQTDANLATLRLVNADKSDAMRRHLSHQLTLAGTQTGMSAPVTNETLTLEQLQYGYDAQQSAATTLEKWKLFKALPKIEVQYPAGELERNEKQVAELAKTLRQEKRNLELLSAKASATIITQSACGLCGKDLTDVPEVMAVNTAASAEVNRLSLGLADIEAELTSWLSLESKYAAVRKQCQVQAVALGKLHGFVAIDAGYEPANVTWSGPVVPHQLDTEDYARRINALRKHHSALAIHAAQIAAAKVQVQSLRQQITDLPVSEVLPGDTLAAGLATEARAKLNAAQSRLNTARHALGSANFALDSAHQQHRFALEMHAAAVAKREELVAAIASYGVNNRLIKKLRDARPIVAKKLWSSVLAAVSTYFSTIRGTPSTVTRDASSFLIDGKPVDAFSGSTKDALGLAIRLTLQKTFLGALDFVLVDEPASGADPTRETAMLGTLATCGYTQTVLVTHSDLADSFAANIVRI